jgi:dihydrofolate reductase
MSLDGYIAGPNDDLSWLDRFDEEHGYTEFFASIDALLIGRRTYDVVCGFPSWPYEGKRVHVMTHHPVAARHGERFVTGTPTELLAELSDAQRIYLDGGAVVRQFLAAGLVDDLTISLIPTILGDGVRLFERGAPGPALELVGSQQFKAGLVQLRYRTAARATPAAR